MEEIKEMLKHNEVFVAEKKCNGLETSKYPDKGIAIVSCMDTRLVTRLPAALGIKNGDVKMIKNAGGLITDPWDSTMRSVLIAIYELGVRHVMIIAHTKCGVQGMTGKEMTHLMLERGIPAERLQLIERCGIDLDKWFQGFDDIEEAVHKSVDLVKNHPLMPEGIGVTGYILDTSTERLIPVC